MDARVLLCTNTAKDALIAVAVLNRSNIVGVACIDIDSLIQEMDQGVGAILLSEEVLNDSNQARLVEWFGQQPVWSDVPVLISAHSEVDSRTLNRTFDLFRNVTIIERPTRIASLVSAVRSALRARARQLELRNHLMALEESDRRKTEFLATLAHELRNPMAPLTTALAILRIKAPLPAGMKPYYDMMGRQVDHMAKLVDDLMEVSRITRGKIELKRKKVFISGVISDAIDISRPEIEARHHVLITQPIDPSIAIDADPVRLTQVFSNLLNNAARYTPDHGTIRIEVQNAAGKVHIVISDTGLGIAADNLRGIFDMFVQVSGTARTSQGGLGIGLTLVKSLVELHSGRVMARSLGLGKGSEFEIILPTVENNTSTTDIIHANTTASSHAGLDKLNGMSVLVVDDNHDAANSLVDLLNVHGAKTQVAHEGKSGIAAFIACKAKLVILDIGMPLMDGYEVARNIVELAKPSPPILIALTGWGQVEDRAKIMAAGFDLHLVKPLKLDELANYINSINIKM